MLDDGATGTEASPVGGTEAAALAGPPGDACSVLRLVDGAAAPRARTLGLDREAGGGRRHGKTCRHEELGCSCGFHGRLL
ncbi:hypothetical protein BKH36_05465 [Actinomyces naeslundii]|nr:hypothetical protein BKH36_05465 [Actinomyces naeslundii]